MRKTWVRRRWHDFRLGHSIYLIFMLSFSNFILIFYRFFIEKIDFLQDAFSNLWTFALVFILLYIPVALAVGAWHRRTQIKIEQEQILLNNPFLATNFRMLVDIIEKRASKEEIEKFRNRLRSIERKSDTSLYEDDK